MEIDMEILSVIAAGTKKPTHIMYAANMSWAPLTMRLSKLIERGLVAVEDLTSLEDKRTKINYHISKKGTEVLAKYSAFSTILGS